VYNEDDILLGRTLQTLMQNIKYLCNLKHEQWNKDGWKKIVVCIVGDGRRRFDLRAYSLLAALGLYQEGVAAEIVEDEETQARIYEV
jgi:chitin synthase